MESKKSPEADLEKRRSLFLVAGYVVALAVVLAAFEWKTFDEVTADLGTLVVDLDVEEEMDNTFRDETPPPPPPPPPPPVPQIEIVEDDVEVEEEPEIMDTEADETFEVVEMEPVAEPEPAEPDFFTIVEDMPTYPGGDAALMKFFGENTQYPPIARENGITGVVYVSYIVNKAGEVEQVKVVRGADPFLDKEAIRVVKSLKGYSPGKQRGKPVNVQFTVPIRFVLQ